MGIHIGVLALVFATGCTSYRLPELSHSQVSGAGVFLDFAPANRPALVGALDFDLLAAGTGSACVQRNSGKSFWVSFPAVAELEVDELTRDAIAAAVMDAVSRLEDVDGILLTRIVTEGRGTDRVCAKIVGRGVRLKKAAIAESAHQASSSAPPPVAPSVPAVPVPPPRD